MNRLVAFALAAAMTVSSVFTGPTVAAAADLSAGTYAEYSGACSQGWVLRSIRHRFRHQVTHVPNLPDVRIVDFNGIHENRYIPFTKGNVPFADNNPIGRTYCGATVALSDGYNRDIWYLIEEGQGFAGVGDNVEFCVSGFDRWFVYDGHCRILR